MTQFFLLVDSNPQGAEIWLDGADTGQITPYTFVVIDGSAHTYTLRLNNYYDISGSIIATGTNNVLEDLQETTASKTKKFASKYWYVFAGAAVVYLISKKVR